MNARFQGATSFDVVNCGVEGLTSLGEAGRVQDYLALRPRLLVEYNAVNDICHFLFLKWGERRLRTPHFADNVLPDSGLWGVLSGSSWMPSADTIQAELEAFTFRHLKIILLAARNARVEVALCSFASPKPRNRLERTYFDLNLATLWGGNGHFTFDDYRGIVDCYNHTLKAFCDQNGALYIPVAEQLHGGGELFRDICHLWPEGIRKKTEIIADAIEQHLRPESIGKPARALEYAKTEALASPPPVSADSIAAPSDISNDALASFRKAVATSPRDYASLHKLAQALEEAGSPGEALQFYRRAVKYSDKPAADYMDIVRVLQSLERGAEAIREYRKALAADPVYTRAALAQLLQTVADSGNAFFSIQMYLSALMADPSNIGLRCDCAQLLVRQGAVEDALEQYVEALRRDPENRDILFNAGVLSLQCGNAGQAAQYLRRLLVLSPNDRTAQEYLQSALRKQADKGK